MAPNSGAIAVLAYLLTGLVVWRHDHVIQRVAGEPLDEYDVYDTDVTWDDALGRYRRAAEGCDEVLLPPSEHSVESILATSAIVKWSDVMEADRYLVEVKSPKSDCIRGEGNLTSGLVTLRDLDSNTAYVIEVTAHNVNSCSTPKEITFTTGVGTWKCAGSSGVPGKVRNIGIPPANITPSGALVSWEPTPKGLTYAISIDPTHVLYTGLEETGEEWTLIGELEPGSRYTVTVKAKNGKMEGEAASKSFVTRLEQPGDFLVSNVSDSFLKVSWNQPERSMYFIVTLNEFSASGDSFQVGERNVTSTVVHFVGLEAAKKYQIKLQAFNFISTSVLLEKTLYSKLPKTTDIRISNVTDHSVFSQWDPVPGALSYLVILRNYQDSQIVKQYEVTGTSHLLDHLKDAKKYQLEIIAKNNETVSLPGVEIVYTRLKQIIYLNIDPEFVQDQSIVVRWERKSGVEWYDVSVDPPTPGVTGIGSIDEEYTKIDNLTPGTFYTITVIAKNHKVFDTASLPATVRQFTRLSKPLNLTASYKDVQHNAMEVKWLPVPHANSYLLLVYDCSGADRTVGPVKERTKVSSTYMPDIYKPYAKYWQYDYKKVESLKLQCETAYQDVQHAVEEGENQPPSKILGQGRITTPHATLSNMRPGTRYEILVVSGANQTQSNPSVILKYTKLAKPGDFNIDPKRIESSSVYLGWEAVGGAQYYRIDIYQTPVLQEMSKLKKASLQMQYVMTINVTETNVLARPLRPTTNYTFKLTACNQHTKSFPQYATTFTRLMAPQTLNAENLTTSTLLLQWNPVDDAIYYNVTYYARKGRSKRQNPHYLNVTKPQIFLNHLEPNTLYEISIVAENKFTRSLPSGFNTYTELPTPSNFSVINVTDSSIHLTWSDVIGRQSFKMAITRNLKDEPEAFRVTSNEPSKHFQSLTSNTPYAIWMKAWNSNTESKLLNVIVYTKLSRPQQVEFREVTDQRLRLRWQPVGNAEIYSLVVYPLLNESQPSPDSIDPSLLTEVIQVGRSQAISRSSRSERVKRNTDSSGKNGDITFITYTSLRRRSGVRGRGYDVVESNRSYADLKNTYYINVTASEVILNYLEPSVKYKIVLRAINKNTDSLPLVMQKFTELEKPRSVEAKDVMNDTMLIRWLTVEKGSYYQVRIRPEAKSWASTSAPSGSGNTSNTEVTVTGLRPNTNYTIEVLAGNNHVTSQKTAIWKITKLSPAENLRIVQSSVKHDRFHLKWNPVTFASKYVIVISPPTRDDRGRFEISSGATEVTLARLRDGTRYHVTVSGQNARTGGVERSITQYTRLLTPSNVTIIRSSLTSSSFEVRWMPVPNADHYHVVVGNRTNATFRVLSVEKPVALIEGLSSGELYNATFTAQNHKERTYSNPVTVRTYTKLQTPKNFTIPEHYVTDRSMVITWEKVPLADKYFVKIGIESREDDHYELVLHKQKKNYRVPFTRLAVRSLHPASYYKIEMKAVNRKTESFVVTLYQFTKLPRPRNVTLMKQNYMDTEAEIDWIPVERADYYRLKIYEVHVFNVTSDLDIADEGGFSLSDDVMDDKQLADTTPFVNYTLVASKHVDQYDFNLVKGLKPTTRYQAAVQAFNKDTYSSQTKLDFTTMSPCSGDYYHFPNTHLSSSLPLKSFSNATVDECLDLCCQERSFKCLSVSVNASTTTCLLFAEDRNSAPPLTISRTYDHYERKFWQEVSGFQIRSITHNNVAVMNETVELTLTFVYLGNGGCVRWDFGDGGEAFHSILGTNCSHFCRNSDDVNCTVIDTDPNSDSNRIKIKHDYDMETVFKVVVNVTDDDSYEVSSVNVAINERGCIYPQITIEEEGKNINDPKRMFRSHKLLMSATPTIICNNFPGVQFLWGAISFAADKRTPTSSFPLKSLGSEIMVPALTFPLGLYRVSVAITVLDEQHDLTAVDFIYLQVVASPLVAQIKGGTMRTVGANRVVTWDAASVSYDPDIVDDRGQGMSFNWFCQNYTDDKMLPLNSGSCFTNIRRNLKFEGAGKFSLNTSLMHLYVEYRFMVFVSKGGRTNKFEQRIIVKEGDPPDFQIKCAENCRTKMNPTQALGLQAICHNCKAERKPRYKWRLYEVVTLSNASHSNPNSTNEASAHTKTKKERYVEILGWEKNSTTNSSRPIVVLNKNALTGGRQYVMRVNISMDGLDDRVYSFSDFDFLTNLPPFGGECTTAGSNGNCQEFVPHRKMHLFSIEPRETLTDTTVEKCAQFCCLTRLFMCLSLSYNNITSECVLFDQNKESSKQGLKYSPDVDHYQRLFYRGGAVVDEVVFECRNWKDEGEEKAYPPPGKRPPKPTLTYKFTTLPQSNRTERLLLYFGNVLTTPGISMALGDANDNYGVTVIAQVCDMYGECALSNVIYLQIVPPNSPHMAATLSGITSGNASKLAILSNTGNSKAAAQLVQSISSIINMEDDDVVHVTNYTAANLTTTRAWTTTPAPTTVAMTTAASYLHNASRNASDSIRKDEKKNLRSDVVRALSDATSGMTSIDNLQQMTSAMSAITRKTDEVDEGAQKQAANTVRQMAGSLNQFAEESNKEDVTSAASDIVGSLGSVAKASETDMGDLKSQLMERTEIDYSVLDQRDLSPDEYEYYNKKKLKEEKRRVRRSALGSEEVVNNAVEAMGSTASALLGKQMEGEPPLDVSSDQLEMKVEKTSPGDLANRNISTGSGTSIKLPDTGTLLGNNATNLTEPIDMQVTAFKENPFGFGEDAAFIDSPVTMLKIGNNNGEQMGSTNDTEDDGDKPGVGISVPSKFDSNRDMVTVERNINDTGLSISKFEVISTNNAVLIIVEPEDERSEFDIYIRHQSKPTEELHDYKFSLPHKLWEVNDDTELYKIIIPEKEVLKVGVFFIGIKDKLNVTQRSTGARVRRRRSIGVKNSTTYHLLIATPGCRRFDQEKKSWTGDGCRVDSRSTPEVTECVCTKLSATSVFSAEFFVPPNTINFATVWAKVDIADNPAVFATIISFVILYVIMLVWANRMDISDAKKWSLKSTLDNRKEDKNLYQVTVFTGHGRTAATHSKVSCVIFGANGKSRVRQLAIKEDQNPFTRSSVVHFLIREPKDLGELTHAHVWHDNSGKGENRSWYLDQIVVQNVRLGKRYFFICDEWLAVDHDDGKVDRILPVATPENMSAFHRLFVSTTTQKFTEDHLWISLFYRPTKSNFTRMQRLSCCICLLFVTMIANAMFFERGGSSDTTGTTALKVGPFTISPLGLWTSFCSTLLVVPVTTTIMTMFKKAKTKEQERIDKEEKKTIAEAVRKFNTKNKHHIHASSLPDPSDLRGCDAVYTINNDGTINTQANTSGPNGRNTVAQWPHWFVYIAWTLTWIAVILSGFFAILYSFEWGREKANRWLGNMMLSFWQSVFIVQPIKVIILSMFVAAVLKKPDQNALDSVDAREVKEAESKFVNLCADNIESELQEKEVKNLVPPKPPSKRKLRKARRLREKEKKMSQIIWEVISYFFYIMVLLFLCHGTRDSIGQLVNEQMKKTFVESTYGLKSVTSVEYFWRFVKLTVLPNLYPAKWYNGQRKTWRERSFLTDEQSYRVGPARMRQVRIETKTCPVSATTQKICRDSFSLLNEEKGDYLPGWKRNDTAFSVSSEDLDPADPSVVAWRHQNWRELKGVPFMGEIAVYPGGGYSAELGVNYDSGVQVVDSLFRGAWVDHQSRAVFTEFTVYNPNVNLFTCVQLVTEFPPVGAAVTFTSIVTFRLYQYLGAYGTLMVIAQIIFVIHLLHSTYTNIRIIFRKRRHFFDDPWDFFDVMITCMDWTIASLYTFRVVLTNVTINAFHEDKRKFVNFQQVMTIDSMVANALALSAFFGIVRFLKLLRFNKKTGMLAAVMRNSARQWPGFFVLALVFFVAFTHIGYLIFCPYLDDFRTIVSTIETMFSTMMGRAIYEDLSNLYRVFGPTFYFIFCFTSSFIILNVLIAIINESYAVTLEGVSRSKNEYEMIDFMLKRFAKWTGLSLFRATKEKKVRPPRLSGDEIPLPPLPYKVDTNRGQELVNVQKKLDKYVYDLEKYSKHLSIDELRDEVMGQMSGRPESQQSKGLPRRRNKSHDRHTPPNTRK